LFFIFITLCGKLEKALAKRPMLSLSDLKTRFTEKTNMPAKKAYVILAAPDLFS
jgi:hypothetical protein